MHEPRKKTELLQARIPYADHQLWKRICEEKQMNSSEALRVAVSRYATNLGYKIPAGKDEQG